MSTDASVKNPLTYWCLTDEALSQAIEVVEEFLDTDLPLEDFSLHALLNVEFNVDNVGGLCDAEAVQIIRTALSDP